VKGARDEVTNRRDRNEGVERGVGLSALSYGGRAVLGYLCWAPEFVVTTVEMG